MDSQSMFRVAQRVMAAPTSSARMHELLSVAPPDALARLGLAHRRSALSMTTTSVAVFSAGALVGVFAALLFAPMSGKDLRATVRRRAKRASKDVKLRAAHIQERVSDALDPQADVDPRHDKPNGPVA